MLFGKGMFVIHFFFDHCLGATSGGISEKWKLSDFAAPVHATLHKMTPHPFQRYIQWQRMSSTG